MIDYREALRRISLRDEAFVGSIQTDRSSVTFATLDHRACGLARIAALITTGGSERSYRPAVETALLGGATPSEIVAVLVAIAPTVGIDRSVTEAPKLGLALGYDVERAFDDESPAGRDLMPPGTDDPGAASPRAGPASAREDRA